MKNKTYNRYSNRHKFSYWKRSRDEKQNLNKWDHKRKNNFPVAHDSKVCYHIGVAGNQDTNNGGIK